MECLRPLRKSKGLTMKQLGKMVDVSESMIGLIETGKRNPSYETLLKLGEVFNCSVDDLINNKVPITDSVGQQKKYEEIVLNANERQRNLILRIMNLTPEMQDAFLTMTQSVPYVQSSQDEIK